MTWEGGQETHEEAAAVGKGDRAWTRALAERGGDLWGSGCILEESPTKPADGWDVEGEERKIQDDFRTFDHRWVLAPLTEYGRSQLGGWG